MSSLPAVQPVASQDDSIPQDTITGAFARAVAACTGRRFLDAPDAVLSYAAATRLAHGPRALGLAPGATVATVLDNNADAVLLLIAILRISAVSAPVNTGFKGPFLRGQIEDCQASIVIAEADYAARLVEIAPELPLVRHLVVRGGELPAIPLWSVQPLEALRSADCSTIEDEAVDGDLATLVYRSGTTGASKGCMISHNHCCNMGWKEFSLPF